MIKKLFFTLLISFLFLSCTQHQLNGIWQIDYLKEEEKVYNEQRTTLIHFESDSVHFVQIGNAETGEIDTILVSSHKYFKKGSNIEILSNEGNLSLSLEKLSNDSILYKASNDEMTFVVKRLKKFAGEKVLADEFIGKMFELKNGEYTYKIDFFNDSLIFIGGYHSIDRWSIVSYHEFDFLSTTNWFYPKVPIVRRNGKYIALINKGFEMATFNEVKPIRDFSELEGYWIEVSRHPLHPINFSDDTLQSLRITFDSITVQRFNKSKSYLFKLNNEGNVIYFPDKLNKMGSDWQLKPPIEIKELTSNRLVTSELYIGEKITIIYKKQVISTKNP